MSGLPASSIPASRSPDLPIPFPTSSVQWLHAVSVDSAHLGSVLFVVKSFMSWPGCATLFKQSHMESNSDSLLCVLTPASLASQPDWTHYHNTCLFA